MFAPADIEQLQAPFKGENSKPNTDVVMEFIPGYQADHILNTYDPIIERRSKQEDAEETFDTLHELISVLKAKGYSIDETVGFMKELIVSKSFTPHPTEHLDLTKLDLVMDLVEAAGVEKSERAATLEKVQNALRESGNVAATHKSNILDEIDLSNKFARIHNAGLNTLERFISDSIEDHYGPRKNFWIDMAPRSWDYDADGKNNAEGWAMMAKLSTTTLESTGDIIDTLKNLDRNNLEADQLEEIDQLTRDLEKLHERLKPVYDQSRGMTAALAKLPPEQREKFYRDHYEDYEKQQKAFGEVYDAVGSENRGLDFFDSTKEKLNSLRDTLRDKDENQFLMVDDAYRTLRRTGFALEKGQTRHNDQVYTRIIDNLFNSEQFLARGILNEDEIAEIKSTEVYDENGRLVKKAALSRLSDKAQQGLRNKILRYVSQNGNRELLIKDLYAANPLTFKSLEDGGNGYPDQERTYLDRLALRALYPLKFDQGVISDAGKHGQPQQKFLADLFGMDTMTHMALNEDAVNLDRQDEIVDEFALRGGGAENIENRKSRQNKMKNVEDTTLHVMRPASDAERNGGWATRMQAFEQYRKMVRSALLSGNPTEIMLGGGASFGRFGGDVSIVRRVVAQELKQIAVERGKPFDRKNEEDRQMLRMASFVLYTEQGRAKRMYSATPDQVADDFGAKIVEMIEDRLDLEGLVEDFTFIDEVPELPEDYQRHARRSWKKAIKDYSDLRFATGEDGKSVLSKLADKVTCPNMIGYMNFGARPASKSGAKDILNVRAIENDERLYAAQLFHGGFYGSGAMMRGIYDRLNNEYNVIKDDYLPKLMDHPEWDYAVFSKNLTDAARFNATRNFEKISKPGNWNFDRALKIGQSARLVKVEGKEETRLLFDNQGGAVSEEEAYLAKIWYDRLQFLAITEASLKRGGLKRDIKDILNDMRPADGGLEVALGPKTLKKWPVVSEIMEEHKKNEQGYALLYMYEDYIQQERDKGRSKEEIVEELGGEEHLRQVASAFRSGTLPHKPYWSGEYNYGVKNRRAHSNDNEPKPPRPSLEFDKLTA